MVDDPWTDNCYARVGRVRFRVVESRFAVCTDIKWAKNVYEMNKLSRQIDRDAEYGKGKNGRHSLASLLLSLVIVIRSETFDPTTSRSRCTTRNRTIHLDSNIAHVKVNWSNGKQRLLEIFEKVPRPCLKGRLSSLIKTIGLPN